MMKPFIWNAGPWPNLPVRSFMIGLEGIGGLVVIWRPRLFCQFVDWSGSFRPPQWLKELEK